MLLFILGIVSAFVFSTVILGILALRAPVLEETGTDAAAMGHATSVPRRGSRILRA